MILLIVGMSLFGAKTIIYTAANTQATSTPLYIFRMEQANSKMKFFPAEMNNILYNSKEGCILSYDIQRCNSAEPFSLTEFTCDQACPTEHDTCDGKTCDGTCWDTWYLWCGWTRTPTCTICFP